MKSGSNVTSVQFQWLDRTILREFKGRIYSLFRAMQIFSATILVSKTDGIAPSLLLTCFNKANPSQEVLQLR